MAERDAVAWGALGVGGAGLAFLLAGLTARAPAAITAGLAIVGGAYGAVLVVESLPLDRNAPIVAAALLLSGRAPPGGRWSFERGSRPRPARISAGWRSALVLALSAYGLGALLLAIVDVAQTTGLAIEAAGALAAVVAVGLALVAARDAEAS